MRRGSRVRVRSTKWDGSPHREFAAVELGTDACGTWLWLPEGNPIRTPELSFPAVGGLWLFPTDTWWSAWFVPQLAAAGRPEQVYVDIATPVRRTADLIEFVDLDLDVERLGDGAVCVLDEDEFALNRKRLRYPAELADRAIRTSREVAFAIDYAAPPFGGEHLPWLVAARGFSAG